MFNLESVEDSDALGKVEVFQHVEPLVVVIEGGKAFAPNEMPPLVAPKNGESGINARPDMLTHDHIPHYYRIRFLGYLSTP